MPTFLIFILLIYPPHLLAGLSAFPLRVEIDQRQNNSTLTLTNSGIKTHYRIKLVDYIRNKDGKIKSVPLDKLPKDYHSAKKIIRYSPRQITLSPGESQTIRLLARHTRHLPTAEYRSFILFQAMPDKKKLKNDIKNLTNTTQNKNSITINPVILQSLALPVIVYQGKLSATAEVKSLTLDNTQANQIAAKLQLTRHGNRSLYGEVIAEQDGETIGLVKGLALYNPNKERTFTIPLDPKKLQSGKKLTVTYRGLDRDAGTTFASGEIIVP